MKTSYQFQRIQDVDPVLELFALSCENEIPDSAASSAVEIESLVNRVHRRETEIRLSRARVERLSLLQKFRELSEKMPQIIDSTRTRILSIFEAKGINLESVHFRNLEALSENDLLEIANELEMLDHWKAWMSESKE